MDTAVSRREKMKALFGAIALATVIALLAPPIAQAAVQAVRVKGAVKIKESTGDNLDAKDLGTLGELGAPGSDGALAVRTFAGGGGLLGTGDCTEAFGQPTDVRPNTTIVEASQDTIITGIIIAGSDAKVSVTAPDLDSIIGPGPVVNFQTTANDQNVFVGLGNGLSVYPSELVFKCTGADGGDGSGNYVILGQ